MTQTSALPRLAVIATLIVAAAACPAHADKTSTGSAAPAGHDGNNAGSLAELRGRLEAHLRASEHSATVDRAAFDDIRHQLLVFDSRLAAIEGQKRGGDSATAGSGQQTPPAPDLSLLLRRLDQDEQLIAQLRRVAGIAPAGGEAPAVAVAVASPNTGSILTASAAPPCVRPGNKSEWETTVTKAFPGFRLVRLDEDQGIAWIAGPDGLTQGTTFDAILAAAGCGAGATH